MDAAGAATGAGSGGPRSDRPSAADRPNERGRESAALNNVEVIAPFGGAEEMVKDLKAKVFPNDTLKFAAKGAGGKAVREL